MVTLIIKKNIASKIKKLVFILSLFSSRFTTMTNSFPLYHQRYAMIQRKKGCSSLFGAFNRKKNNAQRLENSYTIAKDQREGREKNQHDGDLQQQQDLNSNTKSSPSKSTKFSKEIKDEEIVGMKAFEKLLTSYDKEEHNSQIDENNYNLRCKLLVAVLFHLFPFKNKHFNLLLKIFLK